MENCELCNNPSPTSLCERCASRNSAVLAYCQCYLDNYADNEVYSAIQTHFTTDNLMIARKQLRDHWPEQLRGLPIMEVETRRNSELRQARQAVATDIVTAIRKLSESDKPPRFITIDIKQLPMVRPRSTESDTDERLQLVENIVRRLESRINVNEDNIALLSGNYETDVKTKLHDMDKTLKSHINLQKPTYAEMVCNPFDLTASSNNASNRNDMDLKEVVLPENEKRRLNPFMGKEEPGMAKTDDWQERKTKRRRQPIGIQGKAEGTNIKSRNGGPNRDLWISNVDASMEDNDLKMFIENGGSGRNG